MTPDISARVFEQLGRLEGKMDAIHTDLHALKAADIPHGHPRMTKVESKLENVIRGFYLGAILLAAVVGERMWPYLRTII